MEKWRLHLCRTCLQGEHLTLLVRCHHWRGGKLVFVPCACSRQTQRCFLFLFLFLRFLSFLKKKEKIYIYIITQHINKNNILKEKIIPNFHLKSSRRTWVHWNVSIVLSFKKIQTQQLLLSHCFCQQLLCSEWKVLKGVRLWSPSKCRKPSQRRSKESTCVSNISARHGKISISPAIFYIPTHKQTHTQPELPHTAFKDLIKREQIVSSPLTKKALS